MANRVPWTWGPFWAATSAQLPSLDLSRLFKQEIPYAIEEVIFVGAAFAATVAVAYMLDFMLLVALFVALILWCFFFCQDTPNVYFSVRFASAGELADSNDTEHCTQCGNSCALPRHEDQVPLSLLDVIGALLHSL